MGILDSIKSAIGGGEGEGSGKPDLMSIITGLIGGSGGLGGIVKQFTEKGLGDVVSSWIGKGDNAPVSPDQVKDAFGEDAIKDISEKTGMDTKEVTEQLSDKLPQIVDKLTPDGKIPEGDEAGLGLDNIGDIIGGLFGKK